ncbi:MAG: type III-B CRISPR module RAMP protein Cmr1 [Anaerolineales bacterium]|nr:type III-B CRISPR module RAMP protein Cmr1 [Anaerolineales bacterium]
MSELIIHLKTLTPLWTGGVDQTCDRLHETGLIGSLRWWYEALVRGLGGYACDPTDEHSRCKYDARHETKSICAACYLFGTTGWARLFNLRANEDEIRRTPLHFYTTLPANKRWLGSIFGGEKRSNRIDGMEVPFGMLHLQIIGRGVDEDYALSQLAWTLSFAAQNGGLGARLQHGFGQVYIGEPLTETITQSEQALRNRLPLFAKGENKVAWSSRSSFFTDSFHIAANDDLLSAIIEASNVIGKPPQNPTYVPCAFDLRYKGEKVLGKQLGFRAWLAEKGLRKQQINALLGETRARRDSDRSASRVCFGMPWLSEQHAYTLKVFGFAPPGIAVEQVKRQASEYICYLFGPQGGT